MVSSSLTRRVGHDVSEPRPLSERPRPTEEPLTEPQDSPAYDRRSGLVEKLATAWAAGKYAAVEQFFADYPQACADPEVAVRLVYEEFCLRQDAGQEVDPAEILERFPQWRSKLELVLDCHQLVQSAQDTPAFPLPGEQLGDFRLVAELGRGAEGRVFLATQPALSDRPVVVKIVPRHGHEHLSLARLQHKAIVPLYSVRDHALRKLRLLCMPYVGGTNVARLLEQLAEVPVAQRSGQHFVAALESAHAVAPVALPVDGPAVRFLAGASYGQAVSWIGACVADALHYAHGRGLAHLDLKPSNVLLAGDGQPMLLDFHLARATIPSGRVTVEWLGGTPGYMSPEQEAALAAVREGRPVPTAVDGRSDIYSLGLLLYELLADGRLFRRDVSLGAALPELDVGTPPRVANIVRRCLAHDPEGRYADAELLAADLRHCLVDLPRHRRANQVVAEGVDLRGSRRLWLAAGAVLLAAVTLAGSAAFRYLGGGDKDGTGRVATAAESVEERRQLAGELNSLVDRLRFLHGVESLPPDGLRPLETGCRAVWGGRTRLTRPTAPPLPPDLEQRLRRDLLDLAILWADLHVRLAPATEAQAARREALQVLAQAEVEFGGSVVLSHERRAYVEALGGAGEACRDSPAAGPLAPGTAWEHYALGRSLLRTRQPAEAAVELQRAVDLEPHAFWPNFQRGVCAYQLRQFEVALAAFSACVALAPDKAECFHNRGLAYRALGRAELAGRDFACARRLAPTLDAAHHAR